MIRNAEKVRVNSMTLYHGSPVGDINELGALSNAHNETKSPVVYLTPNRVYALFYIRDVEINYVTCGVTADGYIRYDEQFPEQLRVLYEGMCGYLYKCEIADDFEKTATRDVWVSQNPVPVEEVEFIPDVYKEILKCEAAGTVKVIRYETLSSEQKQQMVDMAVHYIYKHDLIESDSKKAAFFQRNFSEAWNYVANHPEQRQINLDAWDSKLKKS